MKKLSFLFIISLCSASYGQCLDSLLNGSDPYFAEIKECLIGKKLFILNDSWEPLNAKSSPTKYILVTILGIQDVSSPFSEKVLLEFDAGKYGVGKIEVRFSDGPRTSFYISNFSDTFSKYDPRKQYPKISNARWRDIQHGHVQIGMSELECELSWGKPKDINRTTTRYGSSEQWVYGSGSYLYFKNGRLESIQN